MNQQHLENENPEPLRSQRMTEAEARAVIGLWQQEKTDSGGLTTSPAVPDVAEGLDIGIADVQRLLAQVRAQREEEENLLTLEQWQAELEQIRLAEETRKLAEVRRQRAELQRQQAESRRRAEMALQPMTASAKLVDVGEWSQPFHLPPPTSEEMAEVAKRQVEESRQNKNYIFRAVMVMIVVMAFGIFCACAIDILLVQPH